MLIAIHLLRFISHADFMLHKTRGIVFRYTRYGDTSIIVNIFTAAFGLQGYIVNGVRSSKTGNKMALFQPLTLLDLVVYHRENANLMRIKEVKCVHAYQTLHQDVRKSSIAMFLTEMLNKVVREKSHTEEMTEFMINSLIALDQLPSPENFHLMFLLKLTRYLGFEAQLPSEVLAGHPAGAGEEDLLNQLLQSSYDQPVAMNYEVRKNMLDHLIRFYGSHLDNLGTIRSLEVLKEIFR